jgi:hypothetical protein
VATSFCNDIASKFEILVQSHYRNGLKRWNCLVTTELPKKDLNRIDNGDVIDSYPFRYCSSRAIIDTNNLIFVSHAKTFPSPLLFNVGAFCVSNERRKGDITLHPEHKRSAHQHRPGSLLDGARLEYLSLYSYSQ